MSRYRIKRRMEKQREIDHIKSLYHSARMIWIIITTIIHSALIYLNFYLYEINFFIGFGALFVIAISYFVSITSITEKMEKRLRKGIEKINKWYKYRYDF